MTEQPTTAAGPPDPMDVMDRREQDYNAARQQDASALQAALERLIEAAEQYSPREEHDWRCEIRTAEAGWAEGQPPVIRCECGRTELDSAIEAARQLGRGSNAAVDGCPHCQFSLSEHLGVPGPDHRYAHREEPCDCEPICPIPTPEGRSESR